MLSVIVMTASILAGGSNYWDYVSKNYMIKKINNSYYTVIGNSKYILNINCEKKVIYATFKLRGKEFKGSKILYLKRDYGKVLYNNSCKKI